MSDQHDDPALTRQVYLRDRRCVELEQQVTDLRLQLAGANSRADMADSRVMQLEACVLEYRHAKDWDAIVTADATAAKLLPADMKASTALASGKTEGKR
jgi:hypothetical protein